MVSVERHTDADLNTFFQKCVDEYIEYIDNQPNNTLDIFGWLYHNYSFRYYVSTECLVFDSEKHYLQFRLRYL